MTEQQQLDNRPQEEPRTWTRRSLFPFASATKLIEKVFVNPFDIMVGYMVFVIGLAFIVGREISVIVFLLTSLLLLASVAERHIDAILGEKKLAEKE